MSLPSGAKLEIGEFERIEAAVRALEYDVHAPKELSVKVIVHVHREYPKHITVGKDKDENPIVKIAQNADEETALRASAAGGE
jgi:hypothetical protein